MTIIDIPTIEITDYENLIGKELIVMERRNCKDLPKYYVSFKGSEIKSDRCLISSTGNGNTIDDALIDYCQCISENTIVFNAYTKSRMEYNLPKLIHTKNV